jgi:hypothetical protein
VWHQQPLKENTHITDQLITCYNWLPTWIVQNTAKYSLRQQNTIWFRNSLLSFMYYNWVVNLELLTTCYNKLDKKQAIPVCSTKNIEKHYAPILMNRIGFQIFQHSGNSFENVTYFKGLNKVTGVTTNFYSAFFLFDKIVITRLERCKLYRNTHTYSLKILSSKCSYLKWKFYTSYKHCACFSISIIHKNLAVDCKQCRNVCVTLHYKIYPLQSWSETLQKFFIYFIRIH